tara:strand:+ start:38 stop:502 length:465 start_codon:yes stop_codon:yes gene_type:complete
MKKINSKLYRFAMSKFTTGLTVVTVNNNDQYIGKTVNSFASLSLKPPLVLFSLDKKSSSIEIYKKSNYMGINILSKNQKKISTFFSLKNSKWIDQNIFFKENKIPMINGCLANLSCKIVKIIKQGDHFIFICRVEKVLINNEKKPLIYFNSKYF